MPGGDLSSADNLCKQFGPRQGLKFCQSWSCSKPFDTLIVFVKEFFELWKKSADDNKSVIKNYAACNVYLKESTCNPQLECLVGRKSLRYYADISDPCHQLHDHRMWSTIYRGSYMSTLLRCFISQSTIFQSCLDVFLSFWIEPVHTKQRTMSLVQWHNVLTPVSLEPGTYWLSLTLYH